MTPAQIEEKSKKISRKLGDILNGMTPVMVYVSKPLEVNTRDLISDLIAQGKKVVVPIIEKDTKTLRLSYLDDPTLLTESTFHVPEPLGHELPAEAAGIKSSDYSYACVLIGKETGSGMEQVIMTGSFPQILTLPGSGSLSPARRQTKSRSMILISGWMWSLPILVLSTVRAGEKWHVYPF